MKGKGHPTHKRFEGGESSKSSAPADANSVSFLDYSEEKAGGSMDIFTTDSADISKSRSDSDNAAAKSTKESKKKKNKATSSEESANTGSAQLISHPSSISAAEWNAKYLHSLPSQPPQPSQPSPVQPNPDETVDLSMSTVFQDEELDADDHGDLFSVISRESSDFEGDTPIHRREKKLQLIRLQATRLKAATKLEQVKVKNVLSGYDDLDISDHFTTMQSMLVLVRENTRTHTELDDLLMLKDQLVDDARKAGEAKSEQENFELRSKLDARNHETQLLRNFYQEALKKAQGLDQEKLIRERDDAKSGEAAMRKSMNQAHLELHAAKVAAQELTAVKRQLAMAVSQRDDALTRVTQLEVQNHVLEIQSSTRRQPSTNANSGQSSSSTANSVSYYGPTGGPPVSVVSGTAAVQNTPTPVPIQSSSQSGTSTNSGSYYGPSAGQPVGVASGTAAVQNTATPVPMPSSSQSSSGTSQSAGQTLPVRLTATSLAQHSTSGAASNTTSAGVSAPGYAASVAGSHGSGGGNNNNTVHIVQLPPNFKISELEELTMDACRKHKDMFRMLANQGYPLTDWHSYVQPVLHANVYSCTSGTVGNLGLGHILRQHYVGVGPGTYYYFSVA
jgi:hypothetical protein